VRLTRLDREVIRRIAATGQGFPVSEDVFLGSQDPSWHGLERCRERDECLAKLRDLGIVAAG
jgi:thymidylate synthase (FAD)